MEGGDCPGQKVSDPGRPRRRVPRLQAGKLRQSYPSDPSQEAGEDSLKGTECCRSGPIFKHAQRHESISATITDDGRPTNPVVLARSESGPGYEAIVVTAEQMKVILKELDTPDTRLEWTLALVHAATALRPEEAFGLKWMDIDWENDQINIRRGWSKGWETPGKNEGSMTQVVMHPALAQAIQAWRQESVYHRDRDWVFVSAKTKGRLLDQQMLLGRTISDQQP